MLRSGVTLSAEGSANAPESAQANYSFKDHLKINEGALLQPLASNGPLESLDPAIRAGIGRESRSFVEGFITDYAADPEDDGGLEAAQMKSRFRSIRHFAKTCGHQVIENEPAGPSTPANRERTLPFSEIAEAMMFDNEGQLVVENLADVVAKKPSDPGTIYTITGLLEKRGIELNGANSDTIEEIIQSMMKGYNRRFSRMCSVSDIAATNATLDKWISYVDKNVNNLGMAIHMIVVGKMMARALARAETVHEFSLMVRTITSAATTLINDGRASPIHQGYAHRALNKYLQDAMRGVRTNVLDEFSDFSDAASAAELQRKGIKLRNSPRLPKGVISTTIMLKPDDN